MPFAASLLALMTAVVMSAAPAQAHRSATHPGHDARESTAIVEAGQDDDDVLSSLTRAVTDAQLGLSERLTIAAARQRQLAALMEADPAAVLRRALSPTARAALPPEVQALVEDEQTHEGEIEVVHADGPDGGAYHYGLRKASGEWLTLRFARSGPMLLTGTAVSVHGVRVAQTLALGGSESVSLLALPILPSTFGDHKTLVVLLRFLDTLGTSPTLAQVQSTMFGTGASATNFFREASYGQMWLTGTVVGPLVIPMSSTVCDYKRVATLAQRGLASLGIVLGQFKHIVYAFPGSACRWWGMATVGGSPGQVWINGSIMPMVASHEIGHNLGLYHSHALECGTVTLGGSCRSIDYGDPFDAMGSGSGPAHFNAVQKGLLGWLGYGASPPITDVTASGTYTIDPLETPGANPKALRMQTALGDWLFVEYRRAIGFDSSMAGNANVMNGVLVHYWDTTANGVYLLDMTPATTSWSDPALTVGATFNDTAGKVTITPLWVNATTAGVNVTVAGNPCTREAPTVSLSPSQQEGPAGSTLAYTASVRNNGSGCGTSTFLLSVAGPPGWTVTLGAGTLTLAEGATGSTVLHVTSSATAPAASYAIALSTSESELGGSASASYTVTAGSGGGDVGSGGPGGSAGSFSDAFDRPDGAGLGNGWVASAGQINIAGGEARNETVKLLHVAVQPALEGAAQTVAATFASVNNNSGPRLGVVLRYRDARNYYLCYRQIGGASVLRIAKVVNGVETVLKSVSIANPAANSLFTLSCQANLTSFTLRLGGALRATAIDGTFTTGSVGFGMGGATGGASAHRADNFSATVQ